MYANMESRETVWSLPSGDEKLVLANLNRQYIHSLLRATDVDQKKANYRGGAVLSAKLL